MRLKSSHEPITMTHDISLKEIFSFFEERRVTVLCFFLLGVLIGVLKIAPSLGQIHLQQNILAKIHNSEGQLTPTYILKLRQHYLDDPFLRRNLVLDVKTSKLTIEQLGQMIDVKIQTQGGFIGRNNQPSDRFLIGLYVLTSNESLGREILRVWTKLCFEETEKLNQIHREHIQNLQTKISHNEVILAEALSKFAEKMPEVEKIDRTFPTLESFVSFIQQKREALQKKIKSDTNPSIDPDDPRNIYQSLRNQLLSYLSSIEDASHEITILKDEIRKHQSEMVTLASEPEVTAVLNRKDLLLQLVVVSLALGILLSLVGTSMVEILLTLGREKMSL